MRQLPVLIVTLGIIIALGYVVFFREYEVTPPPGWPSTIKLYRSQVLAGQTRVVDESAGEFLFKYLPEYDNHVHPVKIEKIDNNQWSVLFEKVPKIAPSQKEMSEQKSSVTDLKKRFQTATNEYERRAVCLMAIDQGLIQRTGKVSILDDIFGTRFATNLPSRKESVRTVTVDFSPAQLSSDSFEAAARTGWFLAVEYDFNGEIQNYYLTNLHK